MNPPLNFVISDCDPPPLNPRPRPTRQQSDFRPRSDKLCIDHPLYSADRMHSPRLTSYLNILTTHQYNYATTIEDLYRTSTYLATM